MSEVQKVTVPDIGDAKDVTLIEIWCCWRSDCQRGFDCDVEGDKATMMFLTNGRCCEVNRMQRRRSGGRR